MKTIYGIVACLLIVGALGGSRVNLRQIAEGKGLPKDPAQRGGYIVGMFIPPAICGALGICLGYLALKPKAESKHKPADES